MSSNVQLSWWRHHNSVDTLSSTDINWSPFQVAKLLVSLAQDEMLRASLFYESSTFSLFTKTQHLTLDFALLMLHSIHIFAFSAWLMLYKLKKPVALAKPKRCDRGSAGVRTHSTLDIKRLDWASHHWATEQQKMCHSLHQPLLTKCVSLRQINHNLQKKNKVKNWVRERNLFQLLNFKSSLLGKILLFRIEKQPKHN